MNNCQFCRTDLQDTPDESTISTWGRFVTCRFSRVLGRLQTCPTTFVGRVIQARLIPGRAWRPVLRQLLIKRPLATLRADQHDAPASESESVRSVSLVATVARRWIEFACLGIAEVSAIRPRSGERRYIPARHHLLRV
jgi:hypothetical protein